MGAHALGVKNILALTGDHPSMGDHTEATAVFDTDSIGLIKIIQQLNNGIFSSNKSSDYRTDFLTGVAASPESKRISKIRRKDISWSRFYSSPAYLQHEGIRRIP